MRSAMSYILSPLLYNDGFGIKYSTNDDMKLQTNKQTQDQEILPAKTATTLEQQPAL